MRVRRLFCVSLYAGVIQGDTTRFVVHVPHEVPHETATLLTGDKTMERKQQRNIGDEILEGLQAVKAHYEGKVTLRTYTVEPAPLPLSGNGIELS
jgi:hypothetical protein